MVHVLRENPYREALVEARAEVLRVDAALRSVLVRPRGVLSRSWRCPAADEFAAGLAGVERQSAAAVGESLAELDARIRQQPELVPDDAWQRQWRVVLDSPSDPLRGYG